jgi:hypothetical protein
LNSPGGELNPHTVSCVYNCFLMGIPMAIGRNLAPDSYRGIPVCDVLVMLESLLLGKDHFLLVLFDLPS